MTTEPVTLTVSETDKDGTVEFDMEATLFHESYVPTLLVFARDVEDMHEGNTRYLSYFDENPHTRETRGLVSIWARSFGR